MFNNLMRKFALLISKFLLEKKYDNKNCLPSIIYPVSGESNNFLNLLVADSVKLAFDIQINGHNPSLPDGEYVNVFPGEHYRLLNALVKITNAENVVEIGTWTGMGSKAILHDNPNVTLASFDIIAWNKLNVESHLDESFAEHNPQFTQILTDLSSEDNFEKNFDVLNNANVIFVDGPKNSVFEKKFLELLQSLDCKENKLLILDDIRFLNMIDLWRSIKSPKIDVTSLGHWSGTGIVDISQKLKFY